MSDVHADPHKHHHHAGQKKGVAALPPPRYLQALAPLSPDEIKLTWTSIKADADLGRGALFGNLDLREPTPEEWRDHLSGKKSLVREARVDISHKDRPGVWMVIVSIGGKSIVSRRHFPTAKSAFQVEQLLDVERFVKADPRFVEACRKRGITDMTGVCVDSWSGGNFGDPGEEGHMISYAHCWLRLHANENFYAHPIDGLNVAVDVKTGEVLRIDDHGGPPIPMAEINYDPEFLPPPRDPMKPLNVVQPEGASFTMDGNAIAWDKWTLGIGFCPREGIILHDIRYDGRPVVRRAAIAELVVPYGSPERGHYRKNIFDIGEYGFGKFNHSLKLGCDCLGVIHYLDSHYCGLDGGTVTIEKGICIHEEDTGILWKHWDFRADRTELRRGRRLVISCVNTVGNYEYAQYWYLDQAGEISFEVKATGIVNTMACEPGQAEQIRRRSRARPHRADPPAHLLRPPGHGRSMAAAIRWSRSTSYAEPMGDGNRFGNGFYAEETVHRDRDRPPGERRYASELAHRQPQQAQRRRQARRLPPACPRLRHVIPRRGRPIRHPLEFHPQPCVGHAVRRRRALPGRRICLQLRRQRRPCGDRQAESPGRKHRPRRLALLRPASRRAAGGLSGAAMHVGRLQPDAVRVLLAESVQ